MLELEGLHKRYGEVVALDGLSFTVPAGQMLGFLGPNGAGKTTAMRVIMGVQAADAGATRWEGRPIGASDRLRFGYMPEERGLYPSMKVGEQLVYFGRLHGLPAGAAAERACYWAERLGITDRAGSRVGELSLGNQQRAQLASALVHDPDLLVLDEPFSGLDPLGVEVLGAVLLERAREGAAVVFSSHQLDLVEEMCDAVAIVNRGKVVMAGSIDDVRARGPRRFRVGVEGGSTSWVESFDAGMVLAKDDGSVIVELDDGADPQRLLAAAQAAGPVVHWSTERPRLSELFRAVAR